MHESPTESMEAKNNNEDIQNREEPSRSGGHTPPVLTLKLEKRRGEPTNQLFSINSFTAWQCNVGLATNYKIAPQQFHRHHENDLLSFVVFWIQV